MVQSVPWHRKVDAAFMKKIAIITMFIDHMTLSFLEVARNADGERIMNTFPMGKILDQIGRGIGRLAFPVFCFLIVEGLIHTRNRWKYLVRLLIFAAISQIPFKLLVFPTSTKPHADTIFTLAIGYTLIWSIDVLCVNLCGGRFRPTADANAQTGAQTQTQPSVLGTGLLIIFGGGLTAAACILAKRLCCDYSYGGVICILLMYILYRTRELSLGSAWAWLTYYNHNEMLALTGFALIWCYNGERGRQHKYFFYFFYPGHLIVLYLIRKAIWGI